MVHEDRPPTGRFYPSLRKNQFGGRMEAGLMIALAGLLVLLVVTLP